MVSKQAMETGWPPGPAGRRAQVQLQGCLPVSAQLLFTRRGGGRGTFPLRSPHPLARMGLTPHMDLESVSLLLMSTSKSLSFALMCLYSVYSSAIGVRSSFWTFLMETKRKGANDQAVSFLEDTVYRVSYHHVESLSPHRISVAKHHWCQDWSCV